MDETKKAAILELYHEKPTRGRRQIQMILKRKLNIHMSLVSVHRYMKILNIKSIRRKRYNYIKKEMLLSKTSANVINQDFPTSNCRHCIIALF